MKKIKFEDFEKMMTYDVVKNNACIEVHFHIDNATEHGSCWLGKTVGRETNQAIYWYGLIPDGSQAHKFKTSHDFLNAPVFQGKNIMEIWEAVTVNSIDGCDVEERLVHFLRIE